MRIDVSIIVLTTESQKQWNRSSLALSVGCESCAWRLGPNGPRRPVARNRKT